MNKQIFSQTGFAVVAFLLCFFANAQTLIPDSNGIIYVKTAASGNGDGSSWNDATSNLQGAINATDVTKVFVAIGNYDVPSPNSFVMKNGVEIYGGFDPLNNITDLTHNRILPNHGVSEGSVLNGKNERPVIWNYQNGVTATAVLDGFTITGGYRNTNGGGIMNFYASPTLTNLVIKGNNADNGAAGIYNDNASPKISNVIIKENSAGNIGGGITNVNASSPELTNVLITGNTATNYAGGLFNISTGIATLTNVTIVGNSPDAVTINTGTVNLNNSLVFGTVSGTYTAQYSLVEGNTNFTNGNIDPTGIATTAVFTDAVNGDYTLLSTSPAVNTGNNSLNVTATDLAGNSRVAGLVIDMGAYEFSPIPLTPDANGIIYVKTSFSGLGNGSSWADATSDLHNAIHTENVQKVFVAVGNYPVGESSFVMKNGVEIYGGFDPDNGIIDLDDERILHTQGTAEGSVLDGENARPVVWNFNNGLDNTAVLDGFTIKNGYTAERGGGVFNSTASPLLNNLVIKNNSGRTGGCGMANFNNAATIQNTHIINNSTSSIASSEGGGVYNEVSTATFTNVIIKGNSLHSSINVVRGGGMYNSYNSSIKLTNVLVVDNSVICDSNWADGGGVLNSGSGSTFINVTVARNYASGTVCRGGGIASIGGSCVVRNSIVWGNTLNSIWDNNQGVDFYQSSGTTSVKNSLTQVYTGSPSDMNITGENPDFTNEAIGDYSLNENSPAINAGDDSYYEGLDENTLDLAGNARVYGATIDLGAYESTHSYIALTPDANGIIYVKETASGSKNGSDWDNATSNLKKAIQTTDVEQVWVATGTYQVNNIQMKNGVSVYGGFDPDNGIDDLTDSRMLPDPDANIEGAVLNGQNAGVIISNNNNGLDNTAVLDGFTLTNGKNSTGGAIYNNGASPTLQNLWIKENTATSDGGAMFNLNLSSPVMTNITIENNTANYAGGVFNRNSSSPVMTDVVIRNNTANNDGGAMYNDVSASPVMTNVTLTGNSAQNGAGIYNRTDSSPVITNTLIANNTAVTNGGAIRNEANSSPQLTNVTLANNSGSNALYATGGTTTINNSLVFGTVSGTYTAQYSLIEGNTDFTNGNINPTGIATTAVFTDVANGDYTLLSTSPAVNTGNNALFTGLDENTLDLAGNSRVFDFGNGGVIDMGAFESQYAPLTPDSNGIIYVKETATGEENGNSWANATADLHGAIKANGVQKVFVAVGNYPVGDQSFVMKNGVEIYGGFDPANGIDDLTDSRVLPTLSQEGSVLDGEGTKTVVSNEFTVDNPLYNTAVLDGFTLTNGSYPTLYGGGICNYYASPVLTNLIIKNSTANRGGGMYNEHSAPEVTNIVLHNNYGYRGSGVYNMESAPVFTNVTLSENEAGNGTIYNNTSSVVFTNIKITGNSAGNGAAVYNFDASAVFTNVEITENATDNGTNDAIIVNMFEQDMLFYNATIAYNNSPNIFDNVDAGEIRLKNSIVFNAIDDWNHFTAEHSFIQENEDDSNGNIVFDTYINEDDVFMNPDNGDFTLAIDSPVINLGNNALYPGLDENTLDLAGNPRLFGTTIDLGAYESNFAPASQHCLYATTWNGTQWSNGEPDYETQVIIDGELVVDNYLDACEIIVTANGSLRVLGYATLYTEWSVTNLAAADAFVIENNGGLMQWEEEEANTGAITVKRESSPMFRLDYTLWSSPVADMKLIDFSDVSPTGGLGTLWNRVYTLGATAWNQVWTSQPDFETDTQEFETAKGYLYRSKNVWVTRDSGNPAEKDLGIFIGTPNNGTFNIDTPLAFNALGNPYPSSFSVNHFMYINSGVEAVYFWTNVNASNGASYQYNNWAYYNLSGGTGVQLEGAGAQLQIPDGIVLPGQGFVVGVTEGNTSVTFNNWMRETTSGGSLFFRQMDAERHRYWLNLANEEMTFNQILIAYLENATQGVDTGMDAKMFSYEGNALYSLIENSSENYVIQGRELPFTDTDVVPLGFRAVNAGSFTISLDHFDGLFEDGNTTIYLKDNFSQTQHNLNEEAYTFVSEEGVFNNRFEVVYQTTMSVENPDWQYNWVVFKQDKGFQIQTQGFEMKEVMVYDLLGRNIYTSKAEGTTHQIPALGASGVYIVKVTTTEDTVLSKKVR